MQPLNSKAAQTQQRKDKAAGVADHLSAGELQLYANGSLEVRLGTLARWARSPVMLICGLTKPIGCRARTPSSQRRQARS